MPDALTVAAFAWSIVLLAVAGVLLLRTPDTLHRILALDVLGSLVIIVLATLSYVQGVSFYIDAALALALLSLTATLVSARYVTRGRRER